MSGSQDGLSLNIRATPQGVFAFLENRFAFAIRHFLEVRDGSDFLRFGDFFGVEILEF